jgi:hypothetical protein
MGVVKLVVVFILGFNALVVVGQPTLNTESRGSLRGDQYLVVHGVPEIAANVSPLTQPRA